MLYICTKLVKTDYIIKVVKIVGSELDENRMDGSSDSVEIKKKDLFWLWRHPSASLGKR